MGRGLVRNLTFFTGELAYYEDFSGSVCIIGEELEDSRRGKEGPYYELRFPDGHSFDSKEAGGDLVSIDVAVRQGKVNVFGKTNEFYLIGSIGGPHLYLASNKMEVQLFIQNLCRSARDLYIDACTMPGEPTTIGSRESGVWNGQPWIENFNNLPK